MARPKNSKKPTGKVVTMSPEAAVEGSTAEAEPQTPFDQPAPAAQPAAPAAPEQVARKKLTFFQRVAAVPRQDWGTRVFIYVYCLEPICNLKMGGESKYLVRLSAPIEDEQALMIDYGSGKYRLQMVHRKPGGDKGDTTDLTEIEIYNPKYPPKIPRAVWMNDPRNERWAALLPKEEPPQPPTPLGTVTDAFQTFTQMQKSIREELTPAAPPPSAPATDPVQVGLQIAQMFMTTKADNPMVDIMREQMKIMADSQQKALDREAALQRELRDLAAKRNEQPEHRYGLKEAIGEIKEFLPAVKEFFPQVTEAVRAGRTSWLDVAQSVAPGVIDWMGRIGVAVASRSPMPPNGYPAMQPPQIPPPANGQPPQQTNGQPPQQPQMPPFVQFMAQPLVFNSFRTYFQGAKEGRNTGGDFAQWAFDGGGEQPLKDARSMGSAQIMSMLRANPAIWALFQADEAKLTEFIDQALAWQPEADDSADDDDEPDDDPQHANVVDLTKKGL